MMILDVLDRTLRVSSRQMVAVDGCLDHRGVFHERQRRPIAYFGRHTLAVGNSQVVVESLAIWQERWLVPQVPFTNTGSRVFASLEHFGDSNFVRMQSLGGDRPEY